MHELNQGPSIADLLAPYDVPRPHPEDRAWTMANMVAGLDGTAAVGGRVGALSEGPDVELFRLMRTLADVVVVGAETVRREGYGPVRLPEERQAVRVAAGRTSTASAALSRPGMRCGCPRPITPIASRSTPAISQCTS